MIARLFHPSLRRVLRPLRRWIPVVVALGLAATALEGIGIGLVIPLLDVVLSGRTSDAEGLLPELLQDIAAGFPEDSRGLFIGLAILVLIALKNVVVFFNELLQAWLYGQAGHRLRGLLSSRLLHMDGRLSMTIPPYRLLNVISNESWRAADAVGTLLSMLVSAAAVLIFTGFLLALSPVLTLTVIAGLGLIQLAHDLASRRLTALGRTVAARNQGLAQRMLHHVGAWRLIRLFNREGFEAGRFDAASDQVRQAALAVQVRQGALGPLTEVAHAALFLLVIYMAWQTGMTFGTTTAFLILLYRMQPQVRALQGSLLSLRGWQGSLEEVEWLLDLPDASEARGTRPALPAPDLTDGIELRKVSYAYNDREAGAQALHDVSVRLPAGQSTAIIGRSGSGKSTIANVVAGLLRPDEGEVLLDGVPLSRVNPEDWLGRIALASQELELFEGTVAENILYGAPQAGMDEVKQAARAADADGFIDALEQGYDTTVGDRGVSLSAGQRQRIALARALIRKPRLLILDEATNAMDMLSEAAVLSLLDRRRGDGTTLLISHHMSSIRLCDNYVCIREGRVFAQGAASEFDERSMMDVLGR